MTIEKKLHNHYKRWNLDNDEQEQFRQFKNRLIKIYNELTEAFLLNNSSIDKRILEIHEIHKAEEPIINKSTEVTDISSLNRDLFGAQHLNAPSKLFSLSSEQQRVSIRKTPKGFGDTHFYKALKKCGNSQELATITQIFFWAIEEKSEGSKELISQIVTAIKRIAILTPSVSFRIHIHGKQKQVIIYPHGDHFLDEGIVDYVLGGLEDYPEADKYFREALKTYQSGQENLYRNVLDNLRFSLEQFFKKFLENQERLESQVERKHIKKWFNSKHIHPNISQLYISFLSQYYHYQNDAVKHNENFSLDEVEFMIYLTGNLIRFLIQLDK